MALSGVLEKAGILRPIVLPRRQTLPWSLLETVFKITAIKLICRAKVLGIDPSAVETFMQMRQNRLPGFVALSNVPITLEATLGKILSFWGVGRANHLLREVLRWIYLTSRPPE